METDFNRLIKWSMQFDFLPWRQNRSLYITLVSEIMLQQTTVATVINKFDSFLSLYPSLSSLATATEEEILIAWKGLGYYRRAKNLLAAAKVIHSKHAGKIPTDYHELISIPGIGDYTASAVLALADRQKFLAIDTNIERVISRYYGLDIEKGPRLKKTINELFQNNEILKIKSGYGALNEALMDLGREYCTSSKVSCHLCPLQLGCKSKDDPLARPIIKQEPRISHDLCLLRVLIVESNNLLCYKKVEGEWLAGQWECPTFIVNCNNDIKQYPLVSFAHEGLPFFKTTITKYKISNYVLKISLQEFNRLFAWKRELHPISRLGDNNFSTATQKALKYL